MSKYKKQAQLSAETMNEAAKIARAIQKPNQSKEQTKLITQGIQKGIAEYKKQQKGRARELSRLKKKLTHTKPEHQSIETTDDEVSSSKTQWLAWALLFFSWLFFALFIAIDKN